MQTTMSMPTVPDLPNFPRTAGRKGKTIDSSLLLAVVQGLLVLFIGFRPLHAAGESASPVITEKNYVVFRKDGSRASLDDIVAAATKANVTFLGESHDDPVAHILELEMLKRLASPDRVLSLEMFERDIQPVLDEYLAGFITEKYLIADGRAWKNYKTDYRPLIEFAKERKMRVVAANAPARYVNRVSRLGPDSLSALDEEARKSLPPLPLCGSIGAICEQLPAADGGNAKRRRRPQKELRVKEETEDGASQTIARTS